MEPKLQPVEAEKAERKADSNKTGARGPKHNGGERMLEDEDAPQGFL